MLLASAAVLAVLWLLGLIAFHVTAFAIHIMAYFAFIIPIWVNAPRASSQQVWTDFSNSGGWSNLGLSVMIGQLSGIYTQVGIDTV